MEVAPLSPLPPNSKKVSVDEFSMLRRMYLEKFVDFSGKGKLDAIQRIADKIGSRKLTSFINLTFSSNPISNIYGYSAIHAAARHGQFDVLKYLVENGADVNLEQEFTNGTALHQAVSSKNIECIKYLLENHANPDAQTTSGLTPRALAERNELGYLFS